MRTFAGYMLMEKMFDEVREVGNDKLTTFSDIIFSPFVKVVEADCHPVLGEVLPLDNTSIGQVELKTGLPLSMDRIKYLLSKGDYKVLIRTLRTCNAEGGICQKCYSTLFPELPVPHVNNFVQIKPRYAISEEVFEVSSVSPNVTLKTKILEAEYDKVLFFHDSTIKFAVSGDTATATGFPDANPVSVVARFYRENTLPFLQYLGSTYSSDLLGFESVQSVTMPLKVKLLESLISDDVWIESLMDELSTTDEVYIEYVRDIPGKLERALALISLFLIYES